MPFFMPGEHSSYTKFSLFPSSVIKAELFSGDNPALSEKQTQFIDCNYITSDRL